MPLVPIRTTWYIPCDIKFAESPGKKPLNPLSLNNRSSTEIFGPDSIMLICLFNFHTSKGCAKAVAASLKCILFHIIQF